MENLRAALSRTWVGSCVRVLKGLAQWLNVQRKIVLIKLRSLFIGVRIPDQANGRMYLHLGCGAVNHEQFINIDGYPHPHVHYVQSIDKLPQFLNDTVDLIYASHCLEHFSYTQTKSVLNEWYRVLKKGAVLRLSVPDFDKLVEIYKVHDRDPDVILPQLMGGQNNKYNFHLTALNKLNLSRFLMAVGFQEVREWQPGVGELTTFNDFSVYKKEIAGKLYEISLNIEAIK
jgi:predicted SAM-dependent methyltransferase